MSEFKDSVKKSIQKYSQRHGKPLQKSRTNKAPEKEVVKALIKWLCNNGFQVHVIESKAVYSKAAGRYLKGQTDPGMSDIIGVDSRGFGTFIEAKAPGRLKTLKPHQRDFLIKMARSGAFACVTDSVERLASLYFNWRQLNLNASRAAASKYLIDAIT